MARPTWRRRWIWVPAFLIAACTHPEQIQPIAVRILAFNDFHGNIQAADPVPGLLPLPIGGRQEMVETGGAAYLASVIAREKAGHPNTVIVSAGDLTGASPLVSALLRDEPTIDVMNRIGLDINVVGNHEFDYGLAELKRKAEGDGDFAGADFEYLAANVIGTDGASVFPAYTVREYEGIRVGFIGIVTSETPTIVAAQGIRGLEFADPLQTLNEAAARLRSDGIETIVALLHEGASVPPDIAMDGGVCEGMAGPLAAIVAGADPAIDLFISGHTHQAYACRLNGRLATQTASYGRMLSVIDFEIDPANGDVTGTSVRNVPVTHDIDPDPGIAVLVAAAEAATAPIRAQPVAEVNGQVSRSPDRNGESALGDLIADAQLARARMMGARIAFTNQGGIRQDLPSDPTTGKISLGDVFATQPFGNNLVVLDLTGAQLKALLEQQWIDQPADRKPRILQVSVGFSYCYDERRAEGDKVLRETMLLDGKPVEESGTYRIVVNSYLADGGDRFPVFREGVNRIQGDSDLDALRNYIMQNEAALPQKQQGRICRRDP